MNGVDRGGDAAGRSPPLEIIPLAPALGAEVRGVDLSTCMDVDVVATLRQAWLDHCVVLIRDQHIDNAQLVRLTHGFGKVEIPPPLEYGVPYIAEHPEVMIISNVVEKGRAVGSLGHGEAAWHSDLNFMENPPSASFLFAVEVPAGGGETAYAGMYAAYDGLPGELAGRIDGRTILHDAGLNSAGQRRLEQRPPVEHPIVRMHPETGRRCLYLGRRANASVVGLAQADSEALLDALWEHAVQDQYVWVQKWKPGDLVIWDNRSTMHRRSSFDASARRVLHRTQTAGTRPYG